MEYQVKMKSKVRKDLVEKVIPFYAAQLNIENFNYNIIVVSNKNLRKCYQYNGQVFHSGPREITIELDSYIKPGPLLVTLAHEMVHVKQMVRGQVQWHKARNGRVLPSWCGKIVKAKYEDRPWEIEAMTRQEFLFAELCEKVSARKARKI
jgi:hypothetical protein